MYIQYIPSHLEHWWAEGERDLRRSGNIVQGESRAEGRSVKVSRRGQSREKRMNGHRVEVYIIW